MRVTLKAARINRSLPQKAVAEQLGISVRTLRSYEAGETYPTAATLKKLTEIYGCTFDDLLFCREITPNA